MGLMDFLKKKSDVGAGDGMDFNTGGLTSGMTSDNTGIPPSNFTGEYQLDQHEQLNPSMSMSGTSGMSSMNGGAFGHSSMQQSSMSGVQGGSSVERDLQMISLKLDAVKSELDAINQRLRNLESIAEREQSKSMQPKKWY